MSGDYPIRAYGYDGRIDLSIPTAADWRAFRIGKARDLGTHSKSEWTTLRDSIGKCVRCGRSDIPLTKDHIIPVARGGCDCIHNLQPLCTPCNSAKCDRI